MKKVSPTESCNGRNCLSVSVQPISASEFTDTKEVGVMRVIRFIGSVIRLRSIGLAIWLDKYENFKPRHKK